MKLQGDACRELMKLLGDETEKSSRLWGVVGRPRMSSTESMDIAGWVVMGGGAVFFVQRWVVRSRL
jgi:hypothetical protein